MTLEELERRLQVLEDIEAIKKLKARYCETADDNYNPVEFSSLFTEDGVWDGGEIFGVHQGKQAIKAYFATVPDNISFAVHYCALVPNITVEGNRAHAHWYGLCPMQLAGNRAVWYACVYEDKYVKIEGKWFIKEVKCISLFQTPYEEGWAKKKFLD